MIPTHSIWDSRRGFLYIFASVLKWRATLSNKAFLMICVLKVASEKSPIYSNHEPGRLMVKSMVRISFNVVFIRLSIIMRRYLTWCTMRLLSKQPPDILIFQNFAAEGASSRSLPPPPPPPLHRVTSAFGRRARTHFSKRNPGCGPFVAFPKCYVK